MQHMGLVLDQPWDVFVDGKSMHRDDKYCFLELRRGVK